MSHPPPIRTSDPGSFAQHTIRERLPKIVESALKQNENLNSVQENLRTLQAELNRPAPVRPLSGSQPDAAQWNAQLAAFPGSPWLDLPFYFAEAFFYRRLLEAVRYFDPGPTQGRDPFQAAKDAQVEKNAVHLERVLEEVSTMAGDEIRCEALLYACLWGNRVDLSNFFGEFDPRHGLENNRLVVDHARPIAGMLAKGLSSLAYVLDNVGVELYFDLGLVDFLLAQGWVEQVTLHLKGVPFFLSDAMPKDVLASLRVLLASPSSLCRDAARRLEGALAQGRLQLNPDPLWSSGLTYFDVPSEIRRVLAGPSLALFKGDLNYRRLLGDYHWDPTTPMRDILGYLPCPTAVLRTPKSQVVAGLSSAQVRLLDETDPHWLINGEHGILQLI